MVIRKLLLFSFMYPALSFGASRVLVNPSNNNTLQIDQSGLLTYTRRDTQQTTRFNTGHRNIQDASWNGNQIQLFLTNGEVIRLKIDPLTGAELQLIFTENDKGSLSTQIIPTGRIFPIPKKGLRD